MAPSKSKTYSFAMQKYMLLQEQHQELCSHLEQIRPRHSSISSASTTSTSSPDISPSRSRPSSSFSSRQQSRSQPARCSGWADRRRSSITLATIPDEETLHAISTDEQRLFDINESIKRALTELLNCDIVRDDRSMRTWAQTRLMEAEKELRSGRRRRSSPGRD